MPDATSAYGLWFLVAINSASFIFFAFTFFRPQTRRDWRSFGAFSRFLVALFAEMYGFPLNDLSALGLAAEPLPERELVLSRCRPPAG